MRRIALLLVLPLSAIAFAGCWMEGYTAKDRVTEAARMFNDGIRWSKYDQVVPYLPKDEQKAFIDRMSALEDELEIGDSEMVQLTVDKHKSKATARMTYTWMLKRRALLEKTTTEQTWVEKSGKWVMQHEVRLRGSPLPLWKERDEIPEEKAEDEKADVVKFQGATAGGPAPDWKK